jgi:lactate dehydrogenase-like 2-hydroxyacid dehydrogenase
MTVGTSHIDTALCKKKNVSVVDTGDVCSDSAAEFTVTLVLVVARRYLEGTYSINNIIIHYYYLLLLLRSPCTQEEMRM